MDTTNFIFTLLKWSQIDPHGVFTSSIGGALSLLFLAEGDISWRRLLGTWLACWGLGGFSQGIIARYTSSPELSFVLNAMTGFIIMDALNTVKTQAPTLTRTALSSLVAILGRVFDQNKKTDE